jgi:hypothetical protein
MSENVDLSNENMTDVRNSETAAAEKNELVMGMMAVMASTFAVLLWAILLATLTACHEQSNGYSGIQKSMVGMEGNVAPEGCRR